MDDASPLSSNGSNSHPDPPQLDTLDELRQLLFEPEREQIQELRENLDAARSDPDELGRMIKDGVKAAIENEPEALAKAVSPIMFPAIGQAIRQNVRQILQGMMQSLNQTLEQSFSVHGLKWRWEAFWTGKPFAEVVMLHTLLYSVEQVFLIHRETGLLLWHVVADRAQTFDPEAVSGMMTAIQDFVHDAFQVDDHDTLNNYQVGDLTIWLEQGPVAYLAALVRGNPPQEVRTAMQDTLATIHRDFDRALDDFHGDNKPFEEAESALEACLLMQLKERKPKPTEDQEAPTEDQQASTEDQQASTEEDEEPTERKRRLPPIVLRLGLGVLLVLIILAGGRWLRAHWRWVGYVEQLQNLPGIVVTRAEKGWWHYRINGLRDPLALDPQQLLEDAKIPAQQVISLWEPYQALYPGFVLERVERVLKPPDTVTLAWEEGTLVVSGRAPRPWLVRPRDLMQGFPGVQGLRDDELTVTE